MFKHNFYKGFGNFNKQKKNIFLIIRKQPGEIDWILPVLNNINTCLIVFSGKFLKERTVNLINRIKYSSVILNTPLTEHIKVRF